VMSIKPRILIIRELNVGLTVLAVEYLRVLEAFEKEASPKDLIGDGSTQLVIKMERAEHEIHEQARQSLAAFLRALPSGAVDILWARGSIRNIEDG
jgi:hypothetical protein